MKTHLHFAPSPIAVNVSCQTPFNNHLSLWTVSCWCEISLRLLSFLLVFLASLQKTKQNYVVLSHPKVWTSVSQPLPQPAESVDRVLLVTTARLRHQYPASAQWGRTAMLSMAHRCPTALTAHWATTVTPWDWPTSVAHVRQAFTVWWPVTHLHPQVSTWRGVLPLVGLMKWWYEVQAEWRFLDTAHR